jgi:predicted ATP-dependent serine protease
LSGYVIDTNRGEIKVSQLSSKSLKSMPEFHEIILVKYPDRTVTKRFFETIKTLKDILTDDEDYRTKYFESLIFNSVSSKTEKVWPGKIDPELNELQNKAALEAISTDFIYLIEGPPGTGKSHLLKSIIQSLILLKEKVLFCSSTNLSTDEMAKKFACGYKALRIGQKYKIDKDVHPITEETLILKKKRMLRTRKRKNSIKIFRTRMI